MEKRLIDAARTGHPRATAAILHQLQNRWYRYALVRTGSTRRAIEVVQDSALLLILNRAKMPDRAGFDSWAIDLAVRSAAIEDGPTDLVKEARVAGLPVPVGHLEDQDTIMLARIRLLPKHGMVCLLLRIGERLPRRGVQAITGFEPVEISKAVSAAIRSLRAVPADDWPVDPHVWYLGIVYPSDLREEMFRKRRPQWLARVGGAMLLISVILLAVGNKFRKPPYIPPATTTSAVAHASSQ